MARKSYDKMYEEKTEATPAEEPIIESVKAEPKVKTAKPAKKVKEVAEDIPAIKPFMATVTGGLNLNVRRNPGGEIVAVISNGAQVRVLDEVDDEWYRIESPKGYVMKKYITKLEEK